MSNGPERSRSMAGWIIALVALAAAVWFVWAQWDRIGPGSGRKPEAANPRATAESSPGESAAAAPGPEERARTRWEQALGAVPPWPDDLAEPRDCAAVEADLGRLCRALDAREAVRGAGVDGGACGFVRDAAQRLAARPPAVASELRSYDAILANAFHLYRTLGPERLGLARAILFEEHDLAEPAALTLFRWAVSRRTCAPTGPARLDTATLYAWAAFPFQTLGGLAYLERRDPRIEGLIGFYALVALDDARSRGYDPQGVDPRREIQRVRSLLENQPLVFRDEYLATLDAMADRWKRRGEPS